MEVIILLKFVMINQALIVKFAAVDNVGNCWRRK